ncbi:MAG: hypothetical protein WCG27_02480 [Pseudomonadota bacterium]
MKKYVLLTFALVMYLTASVSWAAQKFIYLNFQLQGPGAVHNEKYFTYNLNIGDFYDQLKNYR